MHYGFTGSGICEVATLRFFVIPWCEVKISTEGDDLAAESVDHKHKPVSKLGE